MPIKRTNNDGLTTEQETAATLLSTGMSVSDVAKEIGVSRSTVSRWSQDANFKRALNVAAEEFLKDLLYVAVGQLSEIMTKSRTQERLKAISLILELHGKIRGNGQSVNFIQNNAAKEMSVEEIIAQFERECMLQRCSEGREAAKQRGVKMGRTKQSGSQMEYALKLYDDKAMSIREICEATGVSKATLCRRIAERKQIGEVAI